MAGFPRRSASIMEIRFRGGFAGGGRETVRIPRMIREGPNRVNRRSESGLRDHIIERDGNSACADSRESAVSERMGREEFRL